MDNYTATEVAYKKGYGKGYADALAYARRELNVIHECVTETLGMVKELQATASRASDINVGSKLPPVELTNADRIRAMSDEELARWTARTQINNVNEALESANLTWDKSDALEDKVTAENLKWLQQPVEE